MNSPMRWSGSIASQPGERLLVAPSRRRHAAARRGHIGRPRRTHAHRRYRPVLPPGATLHVSGEFGLGKAALIQAVAGLWPWGRGAIALPPGAFVTAVPQKLHLSEGTLRAVLETGAPVPEEQLASALRRYGLSGLAPLLDESRDWDKELATGDRQRLALARAELEKPDIILLDEATSAFDTEAALELLTELRAARPDAIIIAFGQGAGFAEAATHRLLLKRAGGVVRMATRPAGPEHSPVPAALPAQAGPAE